MMRTREGGIKVQVDQRDDVVFIMLFLEEEQAEERLKAFKVVLSENAMKVLKFYYEVMGQWVLHYDRRIQAEILGLTEDQFEKAQEELIERNILNKNTQNCFTYHLTAW